LGEKEGSGGRRIGGFAEENFLSAVGGVFEAFNEVGAVHEVVEVDEERAGIGRVVQGKGNGFEDGEMALEISRTGNGVPAPDGVRVDGVIAPKRDGLPIGGGCKDLAAERGEEPAVGGSIGVGISGAQEFENILIGRIVRGGAEAPMGPVRAEFSQKERETRRRGLGPPPTIWPAKYLQLSTSLEDWVRTMVWPKSKERPGKRLTVLGPRLMPFVLLPRRV